MHCTITVSDRFLPLLPRAHAQPHGSGWASGLGLFSLLLSKDEARIAGYFREQMTTASGSKLVSTLI